MNAAPTLDVIYQCEKEHLSEIKYHAQVTEYPMSVNCKTCHKNASFIASSKTPTEEHIPDPKRLRMDMKENHLEPEDELDLDNRPLNADSPGGFTLGHLRALKERRTEEELETLLAERLAIARASGRI